MALIRATSGSGGSGSSYMTHITTIPPGGKIICTDKNGNTFEPKYVIFGGRCNGGQRMFVYDGTPNTYYQYYSNQRLTHSMDNTAYGFKSINSDGFTLSSTLSNYYELDILATT